MGKIQKPNNPVRKRAKDMKSHLSEEDILKSNKHTIIYSTSVVIREMQIKTTLRYHFRPIKTTKIDILSLSGSLPIPFLSPPSFPKGMHLLIFKGPIRLTTRGVMEVPACPRLTP